MKSKETLSIRIGALVTQDHYNAIEVAAREHGMSLSTFIRVACLEKARTSIPLRGEVR